MDNVFIERRWRSLKDECVYLPAFETGSDARAGIGRWIDYYNTKRPHSVIDGRTPEEVHCGRDAPSPGHAPEMAPEMLAATARSSARRLRPRHGWAGKWGAISKNSRSVVITSIALSAPVMIQAGERGPDHAILRLLPNFGESQTSLTLNPPFLDGHSSRRKQHLDCVA